jgi:hypothetical protein
MQATEACFNFVQQALKLYPCNHEAPVKFRKNNDTRSYPRFNGMVYLKQLN